MSCRVRKSPCCGKRSVKRESAVVATRPDESVRISGARSYVASPGPQRGRARPTEHPSRVVSTVSRRASIGRSLLQGTNQNGKSEPGPPRSGSAPSRPSVLMHPPRRDRPLQRNVFLSGADSSATATPLSKNQRYRSATIQAGYQPAMYGRGSCARPLRQSSKCRWGPVVSSPVLPVTAIDSRVRTRSPTRFRRRLLCL